MQKPRLIKILTSWTVTLTLCLTILIGTMTVKFWPRTVPFDQCSEEYKKYADSPGIKASYIKDFCINDTVSVDVTMLEATDTIGWNTLINDFSLPVLDSITQKKIDNGKDLIFVMSIKKGSYCEVADENAPECNVRAFSFLTHTICFFHVTSLEERHAVIYYNFDKSIKNNKITP